MEIVAISLLALVLCASLGKAILWIFDYLDRTGPLAQMGFDADEVKHD